MSSRIEESTSNEYISVRKMIRRCGFYSSDGKKFNKRISGSYRLEAVVISERNLRYVKVTSYFNNQIKETKKFLEDLDFNEMLTFCNLQSF